MSKLRTQIGNCCFQFCDALMVLRSDGLQLWRWWRRCRKRSIRQWLCKRFAAHNNALIVRQRAVRVLIVRRRVTAIDAVERCCGGPQRAIRVAETESIRMHSERRTNSRECYKAVGQQTTHERVECVALIIQVTRQHLLLQFLCVENNECVLQYHNVW